MDIIKCLEWRYATKKFDPSKILSGEKLNILKQAFNLTATSFGLQTLKMLVIQEKSLREKLQKAAFGQAQVVQASHLLVICIEEHIVDDHVDAHFNNIINIRRTSETILEPYKEDLKAKMRMMTK
ncbi:MAG: nitroreductase family protein, partial [Aquaticitalea sp.]